MKLGEAKVGKEKLTIDDEHKLKRTNRQLRSQLTEALEQKEQLTDMNHMLMKLSKEDSAPPAWVCAEKKGGPERAIVTACLSDTHYDEVVDPAQINYVNAYNRKIATLRTEEFFKNVVRMGRDYINGINVEGLVLPLLGDMVTGNIHDELRSTNDDTIINTCLYYSDLIIAGIELLLDYYPKIFIPCVVGNHGRLDQKPRAKHGASESYDYLIYHLVMRALRGTEGVSFGISKGFDYRYQVYNTRYQITHGDQFRGGSGIAGMLSPLMLGDHRKRKREQATGTPYDYLVMGHWHQLAHFKGIIVNGSLKGYDEWTAKMNFEFEPPQQAFWLTDPKWGKTINAPIHVLSKKEDWKNKKPKVVKF